MNERIRVLAEQAELNATLLFNKDKLENFAELIVSECAEIFEGVYTDQQRPERIDTRIKNHFGVKE